MRRQRLQGCVTAAATPVIANQAHCAAGGFGTVELSQSSWQYATSRDRNAAAEAFSKAATLVNRAPSQGVGRLADPVRKARFERWFGPSTDLARGATVRRTQERIGAAICNRRVKLYVRGNARGHHPGA